MSISLKQEWYGERQVGITWCNLSWPILKQRQGEKGPPIDLTLRGLSSRLLCPFHERKSDMNMNEILSILRLYTWGKNEIVPPTVC